MAKDSFKMLQPQDFKNMLGQFFNIMNIRVNVLSAFRAQSNI